MQSKMAHQLLRRPSIACRAPAAKPFLGLVTMCKPCSRVSTFSTAVLPYRHQRFSVNPHYARLGPCHAAADSEVIDPMQRPRSRLLLDTSPEIIEGPEAPELPLVRVFSPRLSGRLRDAWSDTTRVPPFCSRANSNKLFTLPSRSRVSVSTQANMVGMRPGSLTFPILVPGVRGHQHHITRLPASAVKTLWNDHITLCAFSPRFVPTRF